MGYHEIQWKIHCRSSAEKLFQILSTDDGRKCFWAEESREIDGNILFVFSNGQTYKSQILEKISPGKFSIIYFDSAVTFELSHSHYSNGGTVVTLTNREVITEDLEEIKAGWVSVLLALKAYADFGVDLRNHHVDLTWDQLFVDN